MFPITYFFGIALVVFASAFFAHDAQAALEAKVLSPMPNSAHVQETAVTFEIELTNGNPAKTFFISWNFNWDGTAAAPYELRPPDYEPIPAGTFAITDFPVRYINNPTNPQFQKLRYTLRPSDSFYSYSGINREFDYRIRIQNCFIINCGAPGDAEIELTGTIFVASELQFAGYTWLGSSTDTDSPDAVGWNSFSCYNENLVCSDFPTYLVKAAPSATTNLHSRLSGNTWIGTEDPIPTESNPGGGSLGWMTFEWGLCMYPPPPAPANPAAGTPCDEDVDCPGSGTCNLTDNDTPSQLPPSTDAETWNTDKEYTRLYDSYEAAVGRFPAQIAGWGRFLLLRQLGEDRGGQQDWGWVHLRGRESDRLNPSSPYYTFVTDNGFQQCTDCTVGFEKCNICNELDTGAEILNVSCNSCYDCDASAQCDLCEACSTYGVSFDSQRAQLTGFAWAGRENTEGLGWMQFDPRFGGVSLIQAWLATRFGDIFVGGDISVSTPLPAPLGSYNATYVIQANGTVAFISRAGLTQPSYPSQITLPEPTRQYVNVLGRIDFDEMTRYCGVSECPNRYGTTVFIPMTTGLDTYLNVNVPYNILNGKIYYYAGDAVIDESIIFNVGDDTYKNGSGTIIIDGDLTIKNSGTTIRYGTSPSVEPLLRLPSVAWLVRGNIFIEPDVGTAPSAASTDPDLVGAYFALSCPDTTPDLPCEASASGSQGEIHTGNDAALLDKKELVVNGLMMARQFFFERTVLSGAGSEQILYDGRFIANPPPGLQNLSAALPIIREVTP